MPAAPRSIRGALSKWPRSGCRPRPGQSALGELEAAAGLGLAVFLAFDDAAVAGQEPLVLEEWPQARLVIGQGLADAVAHRAGLTGEPATLDRADNVELAEPVGGDKRLIDDHAQHRAREIDGALPIIDPDRPVPWLDPHPGDRVFALAGSVGA